MSNEVKRSNCINDEYLKFLDELRESGTTNMFGAIPYLQGSFGLNRDEASKVLQYWMDTFGNSNR